MVKPMHGEGGKGSGRETPKVVSVVTLGGCDERPLLALAASLARGMDSPLAAAILDGAAERDVPVERVDRLEPSSGAGVSARIGGRWVVLGDSTFLGELGLSQEGLGDWPERLRRQGQQVFFVAVEGRTAGFLGIAVPEDEDSRPDSKERDMRTMTSRLLLAGQTFASLAGLPSAAPANAPSDLPGAQPPRSFDLADGDRFDLRIAPISKTIGGRTVRMLAYNGSIPGPTLRVRQGSELVVHVVNDGDVEATVHWHGLRLDNPNDGTVRTQKPIPVGGSFTYRLTFPDPGLYWYHPHIREDYGQEMGLYGNIVVVPADRDYWPAVHRELTLTLDDILIEDGQIAAFDPAQPTFTAMGRFGNVLLVGGEPEPTLRARRGEVVRLCLTNTANARVFNVSLPGARMKLVGGDSGRYERETFVDSVVIAPSERAVVDVLFEKAGEWALEHRTPRRTYRLAAIAVEDEPVGPLARSFDVLRTDRDLESERARLAAFLEAAPDKTLAFVAEMDLSQSEQTAYVCPMHPDVTSTKADRCPKCGMKLVPAELAGPAASGHGHEHEHEHGEHGHGHHPDARESHGDGPAPGHSLAPAGIEWEDDMLEVNRRTNPTNTRWKLVDRSTGASGAAIDWRFRVGQRVKIRLVNEMDSDHPMQHPFHLHGAGRFLILSRDGVAEPNRVWKDTVLVPTGQTVDILFEITHAGVWMAHCHIAEHHESGMMLDFRVER
jgi:FtsP/CotA-like multicopper oxidase with cupredoxin domain